MSELRNLPKVDVLSEDPALANYPRKVRVAAARAAISQLRIELQNGKESSRSAAALALEDAERQVSASMRSVINLSGVVLHTGLGRARLADSVAQRVFDVAGGHASVEFDLDSGRRGDRQEHVRGMLCDLTGAEDALVVNNAAGAVFLTLNALASGREVILSRGQMVEIGGSFRMPDIIRQSGCRMVEVGCTNKTRLSDYQSALNDCTAAVLRCHRSNFALVGFVEEPDGEEIADLCQRSGVLFLDDQGTGCIVDATQFGLPRQPTLQESVAVADVVMASGDKMLGGPQAGLILGKKDLVRQIGKHPLARALRVDKLTLAGLEGTLQLYVNGQEEQIPTLAYLSRPLDQVLELAKKLQSCLSGSVIEPGVTEVGGGSAPGTGVPTWRVGIDAPDVGVLARSLRTGRPSIVGRIEDGKFWLDPRTLDESEVELVCEVLRSI